MSSEKGFLSLAYVKQVKMPTPAIHSILYHIWIICRGRLDVERYASLPNHKKFWYFYPQSRELL